MLARRAVFRSFPQLRQDLFKLTRNRPFTSFPPRAQYQFQARPATWSTRLWYRKDGTPRSKVKGLIIGAITGATFLVFYSAADLLEDLEQANLILSILVQLLSVDTEFSSADFSDFRSTRQYFERLVSGRMLGHIPEETVVAFFNALENLPTPLREEAHKELRSVCEDVHQFLQENRGQDLAEDGWKIVVRLNDTFVRLSELVEDTFDDRFTEVLKAQKVSSQTPKDPGSKNGDYNVVG